MYQLRELIETLWNVNIVKDVDTIVAAKELIETLWNVNTAGLVKENTTMV